VATYSKNDYQRIAAAIGRSAAEVIQYASEFESPARWYRLNIPPAEREEESASELRKPRRSKSTMSPSELRELRLKKPKTLSELRKKSKQVEAAARKLLLHLGVHRIGDAPDGPGDRDLLIFLASFGGVAEEEVVQVTARIGRLAELLEAIDAAKVLQACADKAVEEAVAFGKLIPEGHHGDIAANEWVAAMASLYKKITGREPGISVLRPGSGRGKPTGPFLRFLEASGQPLKIKLKPASFRKRLRALKRAGPRDFLRRSVDDGKSFSEPLNLSNSMAGDGKGRLTRKHWDNGSLDLAIGPEGNLYAAWTEYEGRLCAMSGDKQLGQGTNFTQIFRQPGR
jgi:hypothetical protein